MSTIVERSRDHRDMITSRCPRCRTLFVYWDEEDLDEEGNLRCYCDGLNGDEPTATCRHCRRPIVKHIDDGWIDPEATGDDSIWRETCDEHDTFTAEHEPEETE